MMKKRVLSILLCLILCCSLLPVTALAAEKITSVSLTVTAPAHGSLPTYTAACGSGSYQVNTTNIGGFTNGIKWYDESAQRQMDSSSDTFVSGHNYTVTIWLEPTDPDNSAFASPTAAVNGNSASIEPTGEDIIVSYTFVYSFDAVAAVVEVPIAGKIPDDFKPSLSTSGVNLYAYDWFDDDGNLMSKTLSTFQSGQTYRLKVRATAQEKSFTNHTTATVNGENATVEEADGSNILFYRDFTAVEDANAIKAVGLYVEAPAVGEAPSYEVSSDMSLQITNRQMGSNEYSANGVAWYDSDTHTYLKPADTFQSGHAYQVSIGWIQLPSGKKLATDSFDTITATATVNGGNAGISGSAVNFIVTYAFPALTAEAKAVKIFSVAIDAPKLGAAPDFTAEVAGEGVDASELSVIWSDNAAGKTLGGSDKFAAGKKYTVTLSGLKPKAGYEFSDNPLVTFNGEAAETEGNQNKLIVSYTFAALASNTIETVALTLAAPKAGEKASFSASVPSGADYAVKSVEWFCDEDNASMKTGDAYGKKTYILNVTLSPKNGCSFANETALKGTLNGEPAQARRLDNGNALVTKYFSLGNPNPFTDVKESDYYYDAVLWAYYAEPQVTNGIGNNQFGPNSAVTRGQAMTFLWRAAGCPEPKTAKNPFADIKESDYWYKAILWASENGIANGTGNGNYSPNMTCSRAHIVTFLYRTAGEPNKTGSGLWYGDAVNWANANALTAGTAETFNPSADCPRGDMVLYLYRQLAK